jgi:hypothetical protein
MNFGRYGRKVVNSQSRNDQRRGEVQSSRLYIALLVISRCEEFEYSLMTARSNLGNNGDFE